jgi:hypothetical protein
MLLSEICCPNLRTHLNKRRQGGGLMLHEGFMVDVVPHPAPLRRAAAQCRELETRGPLQQTCRLLQQLQRLLLMSGVRRKLHHDDTEDKRQRTAMRAAASDVRGTRCCLACQPLHMGRTLLDEELQWLHFTCWCARQLSDVASIMRNTLMPTGTAPCVLQDSSPCLFKVKNTVVYVKGGRK